MGPPTSGGDASVNRKLRHVAALQSTFAAGYPDPPFLGSLFLPQSRTRDAPGAASSSNQSVTQANTIDKTACKHTPYPPVPSTHPMRVNCHAHIFNFRSLNTTQTRKTLVNRLINEKWPDYLVKAIEKVFDALLNDDHVDEEKLVRKLVEALKVSDEFKSLLDDAVGQLSGDAGIILHGNLDALSTELLRRLLRKLAERLSRDDDARKADVEDVLGFLLICLQPTLEEVASRYLEQAAADEVMVALMMDITKGGDADNDRFRKQMTDTAEVALSHPGVVLPFFAVNPNRTSHFEMLRTAVEDLGFLGVKLYPSLGYAPDHPALLKVYAYCVEKSLPVLMHCNQGGFFFSRDDIDYANPSRWEAILAQFPTLKICFAHFGGDDDLVAAESADRIGGWPGVILALMRKHEGVYADISYHTAAMDGGPGEARYFANLHELLETETVQDRILWGTDFHLVRLRVREENYREYFRHNLGDEAFDRISQPNALAYLGLPAGTKGAAPNIVRHAKFLAEYRLEVKAFPSPWIHRVLAEDGQNNVAFVPNPFGVAFTPRNPAHYYGSWFFAQLNPPALRDKLGLTFEKLGQTQIRDLPGWPLETENKKNREQSFLSLAKQLHRTLVLPPSKGGPGATLEPGVNSIDALEQLQAQFRRGSDRVFRFGRLIDRLYRFAQEDMKLT